MGEKKVVEGPAAIILQHNEKIEDGIKDVLVLDNTQAVRLMAQRDFGNIKAGTVWQVKGPCKFVPNKYTSIVKIVDSILINENERIYVQNTETSEKKLVKGPCAYLLAANEELYFKKYTLPEIIALGLPSYPTHVATVINIQRKILKLINNLS